MIKCAGNVKDVTKLWSQASSKDSSNKDMCHPCDADSVLTKKACLAMVTASLAMGRLLMC